MSEKTRRQRAVKGNSIGSVIRHRTSDFAEPLLIQVAAETKKNNLSSKTEQSSDHGCFLLPVNAKE